MAKLPSYTWLHIRTLANRNQTATTQSNLKWYAIVITDYNTVE